MLCVDTAVKLSRVYTGPTQSTGLFHLSFNRPMPCTENKHPSFSYQTMHSLKSFLSSFERRALCDIFKLTLFCLKIRWKDFWTGEKASRSGKQPPTERQATEVRGFVDREGFVCLLNMKVRILRGHCPAPAKSTPSLLRSNSNIIIALFFFF